MGVMMPISKVNTAKKPTADPNSSCAAGISSLERADAKGRRIDRGVERLHVMSNCIQISA